MAEKTTRPYRPFTPENIPVLPVSIAEELEEIIPTMGAQGPEPLTSEKPIRVEEQYELVERHALATNTTPQHYDVVTSDPKYIVVQADGADHYVDFNQQITSDSPKVFNGGAFTSTAKGLVRIWAQTVSAASSTLRILVYKR